MARLTSLVAVAVVAISALTLTPGVSASAIDAGVSHRRDAMHGHGALIKRQSARLRRRCPAKVKSSTATKDDNNDHPTTTPDKPKSSTSKPAPTHTTPPPKPTPKPLPPVSSGGKKVGLAWNGGLPNEALKQWKTSKVGGLYNWTPDRPQAAVDAGIPFFPSLWGDKNTHDWLQTVVRGYGPVAIGCNEVNQPGQAQMSPQHGADLWRQYMMPLIDRGYRLASHSVSNSPTGLDWFQKYRSICPDCWRTTTYLNLHWYGVDSQNFIDYITNMHESLDNKPVIITEMACQDFSGRGLDCPDIQGFMNNVTRWMDRTSWVYMYFWFGLETDVGGGVSQVNGLMNGNASPNALGRNYIT